MARQGPVGSQREDAEAAIADVKAGVKAKSLTTARGDQVIAAIRAREASLVAA